MVLGTTISNRSDRAKFSYFELRCTLKDNRNETNYVNC